MTKEVSRISRIVGRTARRLNIKASVYANHANFDVLCEKSIVRKDGSTDYLGCVWIHQTTRDVFIRPASVARAIRSEMKAAWS